MTLDLPAFADPVADSQLCFRAVLDAMARPGQVHAAGSALTPPAALSPAAAAIILTLADGDTPLWLAPAFAAAQDWITFHTGAPHAPLAQASFVVAATLPDLAALQAGTDEAPETSATVILQLAGFGRGPQWRLTGPGLQHPARLQVDGLPADFAPRWHANHARFPRGVDLILCAGDRLAALPRSVRIEEL